MLMGGRAAGKTVLLVQTEAMTRRARHLSSRIDACAGRSLSEQFVPVIRKVPERLLRFHNLEPLRLVYARAALRQPIEGAPDQKH